MRGVLRSQALARAGAGCHTRPVGDKYEDVMRRNRFRIFALAMAGVVNYWIAVLLFVVAVVVGSILATFVWGLVEGADFELVWEVVKFVPKAVGWVIAAGWLNSGVMNWLFLGFLTFGTLLAVTKMWGGLRRLERSIPQTGRADRRVAEMLEAVAIAAGVPAPQLVVVQDTALNSCSVGRKPADATVVVTSGLIAALSRDELEAVLAYELSRVTSFDTALSTWTAAVTGRTIELSEQSDRIMVQLALIVPVSLARRLRARTLRRQAGQRDILALSFTRHPEALLSALEKIEVDRTPVTSAGAATAPLWLKWPWADAREEQGAAPLGGRIQELRTLVATV